jgi:hypothetical protein
MVEIKIEPPPKEEEIVTISMTFSEAREFGKFLNNLASGSPPVVRDIRAELNRKGIM